MKSIEYAFLAKTVTDNLYVNNKNPINILQEVLINFNIRPKYDLIYAEILNHKPLFVYSCSFEYQGCWKESFGNGYSKKNAKSNCAKALIQLIRNEDFDEHTELNFIENPIGELQELCTKMKYPPPLYNFEQISSTKFNCSIIINSTNGNIYKTINEDSTKKQAKKKSAKKMLEILKDTQ